MATRLQQPRAVRVLNTAGGLASFVGLSPSLAARVAPLAALTNAPRRVGRLVFKRAPAKELRGITGRSS